MGAAAALASIDVLFEDRLLEHAESMGQLIENRLHELTKKYDFVSHIQGLGLFWTVHVAGENANTPIRRATENIKKT